MASWFSSLYDWLEPPSAPDAASIEARLNGYDWEDINGHLDSQYQEALDNGYSKDEIDQHLGKPTDEDTQQRLSREAAARASYDDKFATGLSAPKQSIPLTPLEDLPSKRIGDYAGKPAPEVTPPTDFIEPPPVGGLFDDGSARSSYARGLLLGDDRTPGDFAERYAGAAWGAAGDDADGATVVRAASELAKTLPSNQDFIDQAIAIAHSQGVEITPDGVQQIKNNLVQQWASTGDPLQTIYAQAQNDPALANQLTEPQSTPEQITAMTLVPLVLGQFWQDMGVKTERAAEAAPEYAAELPGKILSAITSIPGAQVDLLKGVGLGLWLNSEEMQAKAKEADITLPEALGLVIGRIPRGLVEGAYNQFKELGQAALGERELTPESAFWGALAGVTPSPGGMFRGSPPAARLAASPELQAALKETWAHTIESQAAEKSWAETTKGTALERVPEPTMPVLTGEGMAEARPVSEAMAVPKPAERAPVEEGAEAGTPRPFVPEATPPEKMQALAQSAMEDMRLTREGLIPDEFDRPNFFQNLARDQDAATQKIAEGWDTARGMLRYLADIGGAIMRDESGALNIWSTPAQQTAKEGVRWSRNFGQELLTRLRSGVERDIAHLTYGFDYTRDAAGKVENSFKALAPYRREWDIERAKGPAGNPMATPYGQFINYVENRSSGAVLGPELAHLQPVADQLRYTARFVQAELMKAEQDGLHDMNSYINDYLVHLVKDPAKMQQEFGPGSAWAGSSMSLKQRRYPTISDLLSAGLELVEPDILHAALMGAANTLKYVKHLRQIDIATNTISPVTGEKIVRWSMAQPEGMARLNGPGTSKAFAMKDPATGEMVGRNTNLYADRGFARIWNDTVSKGFYERPGAGADLYQKWLYAKNTATSLSLLGPIYHASAMAYETIGSGLGMVMRLVGDGRYTDAAVQAAKSIVFPLRLADIWKNGGEAIRKYNELSQDPAIIALSEAGLRFGPRQEIYRMGTAPAIFDSIRRGSLGQEYRDAFKRLIGDPATETAFKRIVAGASWRALGFTAHELGRILNTVGYPVFDVLIPRMKTAAAYEQMRAYLDKNMATATPEAVAMKGREIARDTDARLGEMNMDNVYWPRAVKQTLQMMMISPGWVYGSMRFYASAVGYDLERLQAKPQLNATALRNFLGFAGAYSLANTAWQYYMTGKWPWQTDTPWRDLMNFRTGAMTPEGAVERGMVPSQMKEIFDYAKIAATGLYDPRHLPGALVDFATGKMPGIVHFIHDLVTEQDAIGHHVWFTGKGLPGIMAKNFMPIFFSNLASRKAGTGIEPWMNMIGMRNAPPLMENPERFFHGIDVRNFIAAREERQRIIRENRRLETPQEVPELPEGMGSRGGGRGGGGGRGAGRYEDPYLHWNSRSGQGGRGRGYSLEPGGGGGQDIDPRGLDRVFGRGSGGPFARGRGRSTRGRGARSSPAYQGWSSRRGGGRMLTVEP